jgi:hypothetical protein
MESGFFRGMLPPGLQGTPFTVSPFLTGGIEEVAGKCGFCSAAVVHFEGAPEEKNWGMSARGHTINNSRKRSRELCLEHPNHPISFLESREIGP